jgi:hypothetical protein
MANAAEQAGHRSVLRHVARLMASLGFVTGRSTFFVRRREFVAEFVHLHKYRSGPDYRIHLGIRVLNDVFPAAALNGPDSHMYTCPDSPNGLLYELAFAPEPRSPERCAAEVVRWCVEVGEPWFTRFASPQSLLTECSPLGSDAGEQLRQALAGRSDSARVTASLRLLARAEPIAIADRDRM